MQYGCARRVPFGGQASQSELSDLGVPTSCGAREDDN
jgi:hypothetical protein